MTPRHITRRWAAAHTTASAPPARRQRGAAIVVAMLTVTLVASMATLAITRQWQATQIEVAERSRAQAAWLLHGALDWSRLLLRQDMQAAAQADHFAEPWAIALQPTRLSAFLQAQHGVSQPGHDASASMADALLTGHMVDLQARLNLLNFLLDPSAERRHTRHVCRLFERLHLPQNDCQRLLHSLRATQDMRNPRRPLMPHTLDDLLWLGINPATIRALRPHAVLLPHATPVNLNTASAPVIWAVATELDFSQAQALVAARRGQHWRTVAQAGETIRARLPEDDFSVTSSYFLATGHIRMEGEGTIALALQARLHRQGTTITTRHVQATSTTEGIP